MTPQALSPLPGPPSAEACLPVLTTQTDSWTQTLPTHCAETPIAALGPAWHLGWGLPLSRCCHSSGAKPGEGAAAVPSPTAPATLGGSPGLVEAELGPWGLS